jgi:hypothetical protein
MQFMCWHFDFNAFSEIITSFLNLFVAQLQYISCRHSLTADAQNALLLLRFKFGNQSKADNNTCNGLLK